VQRTIAPGANVRSHLMKAPSHLVQCDQYPGLTVPIFLATSISVG
jgi:hypothetical protein